MIKYKKITFLNIFFFFLKHYFIINSYHWINGLLTLLQTYNQIKGMHLTCRKTIFLEWKTNISREGPPQAFLNPYFTQQFYCHNHLKRKFLKAISNEPEISHKGRTTFSPSFPAHYSIAAPNPTGAVKCGIFHR